jgi:hypothetical protein
LGLANVLQYLFAERIRIAFTGLGKGNDLVGDGLLDIVGTIPVRRPRQAISSATPMMRVVSKSNFSPLRNGVMGMARSLGCRAGMRLLSQSPMPGSRRREAVDAKKLRVSYIEMGRSAQARNGLWVPN